jgi:hypothetical protein
MQDPRQIASEVALEITEAVQKRWNRRRSVLVPPRLVGRHPVATMKAGERVMDRLDELLDPEGEDWPEGLLPEIYLDLLHDRGAWVLEWTVEDSRAITDEVGDTDPAGDAEEADDAEEAGEAEEAREADEAREAGEAGGSGPGQGGA